MKAFRYGLIMQGGSRIVLDTKGPVRVDKAFALAAAAGQPARLVVDLSVHRPRNLPAQYHHAGSHAARRHRQGRERAAEAAGDPRPLIVVDPGHGGIDSGTKSGSGQDEKDVVLAFGLMLRDKLEKTGKYRVAMTRSDDTFIPLDERVRFARAHKASLFISIHADSIPRSEGQAEGASVYTLSPHASDAEAARLAEAENKSDVIAGVDLSSRAQRRRQYPDRSRAARDQGVFAAIRPRSGRRVQGDHQAAPASAEIGRLHRAQGAGRALGAGRTRLHVDQGRSGASDVAHVARAHGGFAGAGGRYVFRAAHGRRNGKAN